MANNQTIQKNEIIAVTRNERGNDPYTIKLICVDKQLIEIPLKKVTWHVSDLEQFRIFIHTEGNDLAYEITGPIDDLQKFSHAIEFVSPIF